MSRKTRDDDELRNASRHLFYEVFMFQSVARALGTGVFGKSPLSYALLESFTIHARALLEFFYAENPREDDVVAEDYLNDEGKWADIRGDMPPILEDVRRRVGKEVAHLTYARCSVTKEEKPWPFGEIAQAFEVVLERFLHAVPKHRLAPVSDVPDNHDAEPEEV